MDRHRSVARAAISHHLPSAAPRNNSCTLARAAPRNRLKLPPRLDGYLESHLRLPEFNVAGNYDHPISSCPVLGVVGHLLNVEPDWRRYRPERHYPSDHRSR